MNVLLDTHIALWAITDSKALPAGSRELISDPDVTIWVNAANIWEIAIKHALRPKNMPVSGQDAWRFFHEAGYQMLAVNASNAAHVEKLPQHHQDPFDRILVAQALVEPLRLLTHDKKVALYGESIILV
ncbi:PIN domain nuclease [Bordetella genomosp. 9]|uniref:type II toxin-antitoxin system VapC family toxin n=1 Tax=Bordetella genomosp. 9 TaxID=1416803 RepID=UPI000A296A37|nr:type II toxin-antitoxin system VapC family toxin [Bordetella genomosp. 9]ARP91434.1 PIN domain nuclease [Bordetella genomosp. 9]